MKRRSAFLLLCILLCALCLPAAAAEPTVYPFSLSGGDFATVDGLTFDGDVIVSGDNAVLALNNCVVNGDIILTANEGSRVILTGTTVVGSCVQRNTVKEATIDYSLPKFLTDAPVELVMEDCIGAVVTLGDFSVVVNDQVYSMKDTQYFIDAGSSEVALLPYEGQEASYCIIARWWEGGEEVLMVLAESEAQE